MQPAHHISRIRAVDGVDHEFGLVPIDGKGALGALVVEPAERLLEEEEPEAFDDQHLEMPSARH